MKILITGALGFVGFHLSARLRQLGLDVTGLDNGWFNGNAAVGASPEISRRRAVLNEAPGGLHDVDVSNVRALRGLLRRTAPTHIVHLAGLSVTGLARREPSLAVRANIGATQRLLQEAALVGSVQRVVFASSSMVYGHFDSQPCSETVPCAPIEPYGASKLATEILVAAWGRAHGVETTIARLSSIYGAGDLNGRVTQLFVEAALSGRPMELFEQGRERLDLTHIEDATAGLHLALTSPAAANQVVNLSRGDARSLEELADIIGAYVPGASKEKLLGGSQSPRRGTLDIGKARELLGFKPLVSLEEGIRRTLLARGVTVPATEIDRVSPRMPASRPSGRDVRAVGRSLVGGVDRGAGNVALEKELASYLGRGHRLSLSGGGDRRRVAHLFRRRGL